MSSSKIINGDENVKNKKNIFIVVFIILYIGLNYYIGRGFLKGINSFYNINSKIFWIVFWVIAFAYIWGRFFNKVLSINMNNFLSAVGYYWLGIVFFSLVALPIMNISSNIIIKLFGQKFNLNSKMVTASMVIVIMCIFAILAIVGSINARKAYIYRINIDKVNTTLSKKLNIVMVSDIHLGTIIGSKRLDRMVSEINSLNPDVVIIAGDIVDTEIEPFIHGKMAKSFKNIISTYGTYAALGNHDLLLGKGDIIANELEKCNVNVLRDEAVLINNSFYIIGRDDSVINSTGEMRKELSEITRNLEKDKFKIVIDHTPNSIDESEEEGINLHFSGHTHRGQVVPANLITKRIFEVDYGHIVKKDLNIIVSSGYGTWGPPIRIGSKSEIVNVVIK